MFGIGAGMGQGVGLVLSKVGMNYYALSIPEGMLEASQMLPFASTFIRANHRYPGFFGRHVVYT